MQRRGTWGFPSEGIEGLGLAWLAILDVVVIVCAGFVLWSDSARGSEDLGVQTPQTSLSLEVGAVDVRPSLYWLLDRQRFDGSFGPDGQRLRSTALILTALADSRLREREPEVQPALARMVDYLLTCQEECGAFREGAEDETVTALLALGAYRDQEPGPYLKALLVVEGESLWDPDLVRRALEVNAGSL